MDVLSGFGQDGYGPVGVVHPHRGAADELPAAGGSNGVHAGLAAGNAHRAGRDGHPGLGQAGGVQALIQPAQIGEAGGKAQHIDEVFGPGVPGDDLLGGQARVLGHKGKVRPGLAAVQNRNFQHLAGGQGDLIQPTQHRRQAGLEGFVPDDLRVVVDHHAAVGGHQLGHAGDGRGLQCQAEGPDAPVDGLADLVAEFHRERGVAGEQKTGLFHNLCLLTRSGRWGRWSRPRLPAWPGCAGQTPPRPGCRHARRWSGPRWSPLRR